MFFLNRYKKITASSRRVIACFIVLDTHFGTWNLKTPLFLVVVCGPSPLPAFTAVFKFPCHLPICGAEALDNLVKDADFRRRGVDLLKNPTKYAT